MVALWSLIGVRVQDILCLLNGNAVASEDLPEGLFEAPLELCQGEIQDLW